VWQRDFWCGDETSGAATKLLVRRQNLWCFDENLWCDDEPFGAATSLLLVSSEGDRKFSATTSPLVRQQAFLWCLAMSSFVVLFNNEPVCAVQR